MSIKLCNRLHVAQYNVRVIARAQSLSSNGKKLAESELSTRVSGGRITDGSGCGFFELKLVYHCRRPLSIARQGYHSWTPR